MRPFLFLVCCEIKIVSLERAFFMKRQEQIEIREYERKHEAQAGIPFLIVQMSYFDTSRSSVYSVFSVLVMRKKVEIMKDNKFKTNKVNFHTTFIFSLALLIQLHLVLVVLVQRLPKIDCFQGSAFVEPLGSQFLLLLHL